MDTPTGPAADSSTESPYLAPRFGLIGFLRRIREDQLSTLVPGAFDRARYAPCVICSRLTRPCDRFFADKLCRMPSATHCAAETHFASHRNIRRRVQELDFCLTPGRIGC